MGRRFAEINDEARNMIGAVTILDLSRWLRGARHKWDWWQDADDFEVELFHAVGDDWISDAQGSGETLDEAVRAALATLVDGWADRLVLAGRGGKL